MKMHFLEVLEDQKKKEIPEKMKKAYLLTKMEMKLKKMKKKNFLTKMEIFYK